MYTCEIPLSSVKGLVVSACIHSKNEYRKAIFGTIHLWHPHGKVVGDLEIGHVFADSIVFTQYIYYFCGW